MGYREQVVDFMSGGGTCFLNSRVILRRVNNTNNVEISSSGPGNNGGEKLLLLAEDLRHLFDFLSEWLDAYAKLSIAKKEREIKEELDKPVETRGRPRKILSDEMLNEALNVGKT